jgi:hypothetical protein
VTAAITDLDGASHALLHIRSHGTEITTLWQNGDVADGLCHWRFLNGHYEAAYHDSQWCAFMNESQALHTLTEIFDEATEKG